MDSSRQSHASLSSGIVLSVLLVAACWIATIRIIWNDWVVDPQYSYGMLVPLLSVGLLMKRWEDRPAPTRLSRGGRAAGIIFLMAGALLLALVIPLAEGNPDWRPLGLAASLASVMVTLSVAFELGGRAWLRHFLFPIAFFLIAVPWPRNFEQSLMSLLMSWNTSATIEILHWSGCEAIRQGNLILLPTGVLGVEEACSGIRSLQSGLMVALFFGEVFRLHPIRRLLLLVVALFAALAGNIVRSSLLAVVASRQGIGAVSTWHDSAGLIVLLMTVSAVFACALRWKRKLSGGSAMNGSKNPATAVSRKSGAGALWKPSLWILAPVLSILVGSMMATELWFRIHDLPSGRGWGWEVARRVGVAGVSDVPIAPRTLRMLFYPDGFSEKWMGASGEVGQAFYLEWPPGRTALQSVQMHSPEVCLSNMGMHLERQLGDTEFGTPAERIGLHGWLFSQQGWPVYVFHSIMEQGKVGGVSMIRDQSLKGRVRNVMMGTRNRGQRMVEVAFWNLPSEAAARDALKRYFQETLTVSPPVSPLRD
ncbi:MAG: exosortase/archaeosortase family protein [Verrucomicrobia bacterium]|nr:exosortase/archaeosortase family protein [Verrucomicrobiota bacterium]